MCAVAGGRQVLESVEGGGCSSLSGVRLWSGLLLQAGVYIYRELAFGNIARGRPVSDNSAQLAVALFGGKSRWQLVKRTGMLLDRLQPVNWKVCSGK